MNWYPNLSDKTVHKILFVAVVVIIAILAIDLLSILHLFISGKVNLLTHVNGIWGSRGSETRPMILFEIIFDVVFLYLLLFKRHAINKRLEKEYASSPFARDLKLGVVLLGTFLLVYYLFTVIIPQNYRPW